MTGLEKEALELSLKVAFASVCASLPFAVAAAWLLARGEFFGKSLFNWLVHLPLVTPPVVAGYLLLFTLGRNGLIGKYLHELFGVSVIFDWKGAAIAAAVMSFPLFTRPIQLSIEAIDRRMEYAARTLGSGPARIFLSITLPLALPGIIAGAVMAFARSLGEFGATITFVSNVPGQTRTLPVALYSVSQTPGGEEEAARLIAISVALAFMALAGSEIINRAAQKRLNG